jgi:hypothetical protein
MVGRGSAAPQPPAHRLAARCFRLAGAGVTLALAAALAYAAFAKLREPEAFRELIIAHGVIPADLAGLAAWAAPAGEIALAFAALAALAGAFGSRATRRAGLLLGGAFFALAGYTALVAMAPPPEPVGCGCGMPGASDAPLSPEGWWMLTLRNAGLGLIALAAGAAASRAVGAANSAHHAEPLVRPAFARA